MVLTRKDIAEAIAVSAFFFLVVLLNQQNVTTAFQFGSAWLLVSLVATSARNVRSGPYGLGWSGLN